MTSELHFRSATADDLPHLVNLLSDDVLGAKRDGADQMPSYARAFAALCAQPGNSIIVVELGSEIVGMLQLTLIPGLSRGGMLRAQIESVRVSSKHRGKRVGQALFDYAIAEARKAGCGLVQLTSDKRRTDALRFYESLGFKATHEGLKLEL